MMGKWCFRLAVLFVGQCLLSCGLDKTSEMDGYWEGVDLKEWNEEEQVWEEKKPLFVGLKVTGGDFRLFDYSGLDTTTIASVQDGRVRIFLQDWKVNRSYLPDSLVLESVKGQGVRMRRLYFTLVPSSQHLTEEEVRDQCLEFSSDEDSLCAVLIIPSDSSWLMTVQNSAYTYTSEDEHGRIFSLGPAKVLSLVDGREMHSLQLTYIKQAEQLLPRLNTTYSQSAVFSFPSDLQLASAHKLLSKEEHDSLQTLLSCRWGPEKSLHMGASTLDSSEWVSLNHYLFLEANGSFNLEKKELLPSGKERYLEEIKGTWQLGPAGRNIGLEYPDYRPSGYLNRMVWLPFELLEDGSLFLHKEVTSGYDKVRRPVVIKFKPASAG